MAAKAGLGMDRIQLAAGEWSGHQCGARIMILSLLKHDYTQTHHTCVLTLRGLHVVWLVYFCLDGREMLHVQYLSHMYMCIVCVCYTCLVHITPPQFFVYMSCV